MTIDAWEAELVRIDAAVAQARASGGSARAAVRLRSLHLKIKPGQPGRSSRAIKIDPDDKINICLS